MWTVRGTYEAYLFCTNSCGGEKVVRVRQCVTGAPPMPEAASQSYYVASLVNKPIQVRATLSTWLTESEYDSLASLPWYCIGVRHTPANSNLHMHFYIITLREVKSNRIALQHRHLLVELPRLTRVLSNAGRCLPLHVRAT